MKRGVAKFNRIYKALNPAQRRAVDIIEGPVMVIAGPGTGKTHVLSARIANILQKTDTDPYSILALTFTDSAAANMRRRVVEMIGKTGYYVNISTIHSFCSDVIKTHPEYFPIDRGSEALSEFERIDMFQSIVESLKLEVLKPINRPLFYLRDAMTAISNLKREGVSPEIYSKIIKSEYAHPSRNLTKVEALRFKKNKRKNQELLKIYKEYEKRLRVALRFDFDDMISLVLSAFKRHELLLREYQEKLHYFLVDEYQDTNSAQNTIVEQLASYWGETANLFVVGDPNQSVFRFQGASIENSLEFIKRFPRAEVIALDTAYRSPQLFYEVAHNVIQNNLLTKVDKGVLRSLHKKLKGKRKSGGEIVLAALPSQTIEVIYIAEEIKKLLGRGVLPEEIAVLYRNNADVPELASALEKLGVAYQIDGGVNILHDEYIRQLLQMLRVISDIGSYAEDEKLFEVMCYEWTGIDSMLAMKAARAAGRAKVSIVDLIQKGHAVFTKYHIGDDVSAVEFYALEKFIQQLIDWGIRDKSRVFTQWFEEVISESGYLDWILSRETKAELLTNLNTLFREVKALTQERHDLKLSDFLQAVDIMQEQRIALFAEDLNVESGSVSLSTVHKAKGREWNYVFIYKCIDGKWGNVRTRELIELPKGLLGSTDVSKKERNEDERRIFYVALTRAKHALYITYPETIVTAARSREVVASMFLEEIGDRYVKHIDVSGFTKQVEKHLVELISPAPSLTIKISETDFFRRIIENFKLSPTALNTYLRDRQDFMQNVLLRVPRAKPDYMAFGTSVHYALEKLYKARMQNSNFKVQNLLNEFEISLKKELLRSKDFKRRLKQGRDVLTLYYKTYVDENVEPLFVEKFFGSGFSKTILGDIPLSGRIDRVDWIDKERGLVRVVDYKTGRPRSIGDIEGRTVASGLSEREQELPESIRGSYKRQLLFYKLLTQLDYNFTPTVVEGVFDFVESNKQTGKLVQRRFEIVDSDMADLRKLIPSPYRRNDDR
ncbi:MAG: ATP-dependent helicase [Candidatus Paceibacterota bacterium]